MAPPAFNIVVAPIQMAVDDNDAVTIGLGLTVILSVFVLIHPLTLMPVTV